MEEINLAVVISYNCPFIEGIQSWQNQFPTGSNVIFTVNVSHSESILASLPGSFHLKSLEKNPDSDSQNHFTAKIMMSSWGVMKLTASASLKKRPMLLLPLNNNC